MAPSPQARNVVNVAEIETGRSLLAFTNRGFGF
jgi:hypothetical protein